MLKQCNHTPCCAFYDVLSIMPSLTLLPRQALGCCFVLRKDKFPAELWLDIFAIPYSNVD